jgi:hypothetical protein
MKNSTLIVGLLVIVLLFLVMRSSRYETPAPESPIPTPTLTTGDKVKDILQRVNSLIM